MNRHTPKLLSAIALLCVYAFSASLLPAEATRSSSQLKKKTEDRYRYHNSDSSVGHGRKVKPGMPPVNLKGCVLRSDGSEFIPGLFSIPQDDRTEFKRLGPLVIAPYGGVLAGDRYYAGQMQDLYGNMLFMVETFDARTWESVSQEYSPSATIMASDLAYDSTTGNVYGCFYNEDRSGWTFGIADYDELKSDKICDLTQGWNALACDKEGNLYAVDKSGNLLRVDKRDGSQKLIGSTGLSPQNLSSGTIDPVSGRFFYAIHSSQEAALYDIDLETAEASWLCDFPGGEEVTGLFVDSPLAAGKAPGAVRNMSVEFNGASLTGTIGFTAPAELYDYTPADGTFTYFISSGDEVLATGSVQAGKEVSAEISVPVAGGYEFGVCVANNVGKGPVETISRFVGPGIPVLEDPVLSYSNGTFGISWTPVTVSSDGGYIDTGNVVYTVTRYPGNVLVAETKESSVSDNVDEPATLTAYYYTVQAEVNGLKSECKKTHSVSIGSVIPPYAPDAMKETDYEAFTIIDSNKDRIIWMPSEEHGSFRISNNPSIPSDDWLITPALRLEAGKVYRLSFDVFGQSASRLYPERYEVKYGGSPTVAGMTETLVRPTVINCDMKNPEHVTADICPASDGLYYVGFHGISDRDMFALHISSISIAAGLSPDAPAAPASLKVVPASDGSLSAEIMIKTPSRSVSGDFLTDVTGLVVMRDGVIVKSFENPQPGSSVSFTDNVPDSGAYIYTAQAFNGAGSGDLISARAYIGTNEPAPVSDLEVVENNSKFGEITLSWTEPVLDKDGNQLNASALKYMVAEIVDGKPLAVARDIVGNTFTYQAVESGRKQELKEWAVFAVAGDRMSEGVSVMAFAGEPFDAPYAESFAGKILSEDMLVDPIAGESEWNLLDDEQMADIKSEDNDGGYIYARGFKDSSTALTTGKVNVPSDNPGVMFNVFNIADPDYNADEIDVEVNDGSGWKSLHHLVLSSLPSKGWNRQYVKLGEYSGKAVSIRFVVTFHTWSTVYMDNFLVGALPKANMSVRSISAQSRVRSGEEFTIGTEIRNLGTEVAEPADYEIRLLRDGEEVSRTKGKRVRSCASVPVEFNCTHGVMDASSSLYAIEVIMDNDSDLSDNITDDVTVETVLPLYPVVVSLTAGDTGNGIRLSWQEPDCGDGAPEEYSESFEDGGSFAVDTFGEWTFIDADGAPTYPVKDLELPGQGDPMAYVVVDSSLESMNETWSAADGDKYIASFCAKNKKNDDWAISPYLYGGRQSVEFMAKTYSDRYGAEEFEFLYSADGKSISDFSRIGEKVAVPYGDWKKYSYVLPDGAHYFAIRCVSDNKFVFMVDNVRFYPASSMSPIRLLGYNVYRNGEKIQSLDSGSREYVDKESGQEESVVYSVSALYDRGESATVDVSLMPGSVGGLSESNIMVYARKGSIFIEGAGDEPVNVYSISGMIVWTGRADTGTEISVPSGAYIVKTSAGVHKIIVN